MDQRIIEYNNNRNEIIYSTMPFTDRVCQPHPGDPIDWNENYGTYPFPDNPDHYGRIERLNWFGNHTHIHACVTQGSAHLDLLTQSGRPYVAISGGPFTHVPIVSLIWSGKIIPVYFWNFKNNYAYRDNGFEFSLPRPLWKVTEILKPFD